MEISTAVRVSIGAIFRDSASSSMRSEGTINNGKLILDFCNSCCVNNMRNNARGTTITCIVQCLEETTITILAWIRDTLMIRVTLTIRAVDMIRVATIHVTTVVATILDTISMIVIAMMTMLKTTGIHEVGIRMVAIPMVAIHMAAIAMIHTVIAMTLTETVAEMISAGS